MGTLINVCCIVAGGLVGLVFGKKIKPTVQDGLMKVNGVAILFLAVGGAMAQYLTVSTDGTLSTRGTMMMILSLAIGTVIGELLGIEAAIERFGAWLKVKTKSENDNGFVSAFVAASCTVCVGAMAVVGSIQDGIAGDSSTLVTKGILDLIIICVMTSAMGKGCIFSAIPVGIVQGSITAIAAFAGSFVAQSSLDNLSLVGSILIFCVGLNLVWDLKLRVANMLPAIIIAMLWPLLPF